MKAEASGDWWLAAKAELSMGAAMRMEAWDRICWLECDGDA